MPLHGNHVLPGRWSGDGEARLLLLLTILGVVERLHFLTNILKVPFECQMWRQHFQIKFVFQIISKSTNRSKHVSIVTILILQKSSVTSLLWDHSILGCGTLYQGYCPCTLEVGEVARNNYSAEYWVQVFSFPKFRTGILLLRLSSHRNLKQFKNVHFYVSS